LRKRGLYQWEARIRKRGYPTTCKTFDTKVEAEAWAKDVETNMNKSLFVSAKEAEQYTLSECLDRYIEEYIPRLKHPKRETDRARFLQKRTLAHRIMATIRSTGNIPAEFVNAIAFMATNRTLPFFAEVELLPVLRCHTCQTMALASSPVQRLVAGYFRARVCTLRTTRHSPRRLAGKVRGPWAEAHSGAEDYAVQGHRAPGPA